jgi:hypothetical protein
VNKRSILARTLSGARDERILHWMKTTWMVMALGTAVCGSGVAFAQPGAVPAATAPAPTEAPGFVAIDRLDASSRAGIELSYIGLNNDVPNHTTFFRSEAHVRYVDPGTGLGSYVQLPFAYARTSFGDQSDTVTDFGDIEVGGIFAPRLASPDVGLVLHAGITLPTGERGMAAAVGTVANFTALPEAYNSLPAATTIKLGVSPIFRHGIAFARLDFGFDWNVDVKDGSFPNAIHVNAGAGVELGSAALMLESTNLWILDEHNAGTTEPGVTLNALAISARMTAGTTSPYLSVMLPLDDDLKSLISTALAVGVESRF